MTMLEVGGAPRLWRPGDLAANGRLEGAGLAWRDGRDIFIIQEEDWTWDTQGYRSLPPSLPPSLPHLERPHWSLGRPEGG